MRVALVDDNNEQLQLLSTLVDHELSSIGDTAHQITLFHSGEEFLAAWNAGIFDLIILDIYMGEKNGVDVAFEIRKTDDNVALAFCTSSNEFASESFEVGARHYLRKPITEDNVRKMFSRLNLEAIEKNRIVKFSDGFVAKVRSILNIDYDNHIVTISLKNGSTHELHTTFSETEALLSSYKYFYSPCKGTLINLYEVTRFDGKEFLMNDGVRHFVARRKQKEAKDIYEQFVLQRLQKEVED